MLVEREGLWDITNLGALTLGRDLGKIPDLEMRRVRLIKYASTDRTAAVLDHFETRGYMVSFEDLVALIAANTHVREVIEGGRRQTVPYFPPVAVREFLANALIHQDFAVHGVQLTVEIFDDRLEIRNPGVPLIEVQRFVDETRSRNPRLAETMRLAGFCEVRGSGVDRALGQIEDLTQPAPRFRKESAATAVVLLTHRDFDAMTMEERTWSTFLHCCVKYGRSERLTNGSLRERFGLPQSKIALVSQAISATVDSGLIILDPRVGRSRRHAQYIPFFGQ